MKGLQEYIESGVLELYVLGQLSASERSEVEVKASRHPEIKAEITAIELAIETYAQKNCVEPPENVFEEVLAQISVSSDSDGKVVPLYDSATDGQVKWLRIALIACSVFLIVTLGLLFSTYIDLAAARNQVAALNMDKQQFATTVTKLAFSNAGMENRIAMYETTEWETVKLAGVAKSPNAKMVLYWNKTNKNILINYTAMNLPKTDGAHEYQLWALVNGQPVSLGVFSQNAKEAVQQMQTIEKADAFAVTIEPTGGSINPTMNKMVVMGGV